MQRGEERQEGLPEYQPGDKIYKLFNHDIVIIRGKDEEFIIRIAKLKKNRSV
ncbi:hypothetical protein [Halocella sp. SP3-1]|uniref:hypothetical protein n=1 Tax=Halocella sp. SP3-1 TaxID=2382161 RepID=UPI0013E03806|nr:hypothetical protein [Halocella sp. SP3-1]